MAKPIKETPILNGKDAERFIAKIETSTKNKVTSSERAKIKKNFSLIQALAK